jgi:hypothetical protein
MSAILTALDAPGTRCSRSKLADNAAALVGVLGVADQAAGAEIVQTG